MTDARAAHTANMLATHRSVDMANARLRANPVATTNNRAANGLAGEAEIDRT